MSTPQKTLLVENISYAEEALRNIRDELKKLISHIDNEYQRILKESEFLDAKEEEVTEETFSRINALLQDAWMKAMSARNHLQDLDEDFEKCEEIMKKTMVELDKAMKE